MNNLYVNKTCEEVKTFNQECAGSTRGFVTSNPQMLRIIDIVRHVAQTDVPILILGESGVGNAVLASYIHRHSDRADGPSARVNCLSPTNYWNRSCSDMTRARLSVLRATSQASSNWPITVLYFSTRSAK